MVKTHLGHKSLGVDGFDLHLGIGLSMTHLALLALLGLIGEDGDLLGLAVLNNLRG